MEDENLGFTTVQTLAEILQGRLEPAMRDSGNYEFEDLCEIVRNAFAGVLWKIQMQTMANDGDRTVLESQLQQGDPITATQETKSIKLTGIMVVDLPRDAGIYSVSVLDKDKNYLATLTKTTPASATATPPRINPGKRYYRVGMTMFFPDTLPDCTAYVTITYYGLDTNDIEAIPRDYSDMVIDKCFQLLLPTKTINSDITNNGNPNM